MLCEAYGEHAPSIKTCEYWFRRFKSGKKLMLCVWWDQLGVVYYELLQPNETITAERYQQQLMQSSRALKFKPPHNMPKDMTKYSLDIALLDYHLFRLMAHGLAEQHFTSYEEAKNWVDSWVASKGEYFFKRSIRMLPERWPKVVERDGKYFE